MAIHYITNYGNDNNNGLSFKHSLKHITARQNFGGTVYTSGYFEKFDIPNTNWYTMSSYTKTLINGEYEYEYRDTRGNYYNIEFYNFNRFIGFSYGSIVKNCYFHDINMFSYTNIKMNYNIFNNINFLSFVRETSFLNNNNTIHNCNLFTISNGGLYNCIISNSNINMSRLNYIENTLFINCKFKFTGGGHSLDETEFTYPQGTTDLEKLYSLRYRMINVYGYGNVEDYLINCVYYSGNYNDIFIDADNDDFSLVPNSVAEHMSSFGGFIGAKECGIKMNNLLYTNIDENTGLLINENQPAYIESSIIDLGKIIEIKNININATIAYRNGHQINFENVLGNIIEPGLNVLINDMTYITINDMIEQNDTYYTHYNIYETFNAIYDENYSTSGTNGSIGNGLGFVSYENGKVQEIFYEKSFSKFKIIVSDNDSSLINGTTLKMLYGVEPKVNVNENNEPIVGNADVNFNEFDAKSLYARYIKILIEIKIDSLKVRQ